MSDPKEEPNNTSGGSGSGEGSGTGGGSGAGGGGGSESGTENDDTGELAQTQRVVIENVPQPLPVTYGGGGPVPVSATGGTQPFPVAVTGVTQPFPVVVQGPVSANVTLRSPEAPNIDDDPELI